MTNESYLHSLSVEKSQQNHIYSNVPQVSNYTVAAVNWFYIFTFVRTCIVCACQKNHQNFTTLQQMKTIKAHLKRERGRGGRFRPYCPHNLMRFPKCFACSM